jgi:hypothetical protein
VLNSQIQHLKLYQNKTHCRMDVTNCTRFSSIRSAEQPEQDTIKTRYNQNKIARTRYNQNKIQSKQDTIKTRCNQNKIQSKQDTIKTRYNQNKIQSKQDTIKTRYNYVFQCRICVTSCARLLVRPARLVASDQNTIAKKSTKRRS